MESVSQVGGLLFVPAFPAHRLAPRLVGLDASVASQQPPIEDNIAHGSLRVLQRTEVFLILGNVTGGHMQGSPSALQACSMLDLEGNII
eukprot:scaffold6275_cov20-Tisochrysis_lutea.AAC.2